MLSASPNAQPAEGAFESLYAALRAQARHYLRREQNAHSLSPTMLVHEAWIALARSQDCRVADRDHYFRLVSRVMKNLLIDHARRKRAIIHGSGAQHVEWNAARLASRDEFDQVLAVAGAMEQLRHRFPQPRRAGREAIPSADSAKAKWGRSWGFRFARYAGSGASRGCACSSCCSRPKRGAAAMRNRFELVNLVLEEALDWDDAERPQFLATRCGIFISSCAPRSSGCSRLPMQPITSRRTDGRPGDSFR